MRSLYLVFPDFPQLLRSVSLLAGCRAARRDPRDESSERSPKCASSDALVRGLASRLSTLSRDLRSQMQVLRS
jgi:hypothetical protein